MVLDHRPIFPDGWLAVVAPHRGGAAAFAGRANKVAAVRQRDRASKGWGVIPVGVYDGLRGLGSKPDGPITARMVESESRIRSFII
jgi:hypothetical protein